MAGPGGLTPPSVLIVGAGLTGCTLAHALAREGVACTLLEAGPVPGGLIRSAHLEGVLHEPHGTHVLHTEDQEVWDLATAMTPFNAYRHRVQIVADGQLLHWPILLSDIQRQSRAQEILAELEARRGVDADARAAASDFESWCLDLMGPILYERFVRPYTEKQWGRPARELRADWAPRRVAVRWDDDPFLFPDALQGWPAGPGGYTDLIEGLLDLPGIELRCGHDVDLQSLRVDPHAAVVITAPLDRLCADRLGPLPWRGVAVRSVHVPHVQLAQGAMVVNYPGPEFPFIRVHETKHASGQVCDGTVLGFEFPGAPARHYPVPTPEHERLNRAYQDLVRERLGPDRVRFAGRLASYRYLDMDECMREALDTASELLAAL